MSRVQGAMEAFGLAVGAGFGEGPGRRRPAARHARGEGGHAAPFAQQPASLAAHTAPAGRARLLSPRERDVVILLAGGLRTNRIAERLGISDATVELHLRNARRKLNASTSAQAVANALLWGEIAL